MRRSIAVLASAVLLLALAGAPALAGKKKVHETFGATLLPFPNLSSATGTARSGCSAGQEGVHWVGVPFKSPGKGTLRLWMEGFTGDHDLYVYDGDTKLAESINDQVAGAPPEEELSLPLTNGQEVVLIACNWAGEPGVEAHYEGTFK
ncbi:MAG TPA: hypothetical protein VG408_08160 [Actinomycetota bacterium]|nr:hypothetical protein [Actinomycetota bacterium]